MRYGEGEPLDLGDLPYDVQRTLVARAHRVRPASVDGWPADEFAIAIATLGVRV